MYVMQSPTTPSKRKKEYEDTITVDRAFALTFNKEFHLYAIQDYYRRDKSDNSYENIDISNFDRDLEEFEIALSDKGNFTNRQIARRMQGANQLKFKSILRFTSDSWEITHLPPEECKASCSFWRKFTSDRFISVIVRGEVPPNRELFLQEQFYRSSFIFGGRRYEFVGGKSETSRDDSAADCVDYLFTAWYFAVASTENTVQHLKIVPITIGEVWQSLADFNSMDNLSFTKLNSRLALGFSMSLDVSQFLASNVIITDDIESPTKKVTTDGCGFIHESLVDCIPYGISSGVPTKVLPGYFSRKQHNIPKPAFIQIRLICAKGLFKGCLIVTGDEKLCAKDSIFVRKSMRKAEGSTKHTGPFCTLEVCCTFEHPNLVSSLNNNLDFQNCSPAHLNRQACLLLASIGVPEVKLEAMMHMQLEKLKIAHIDQAAAFRLVKKSRISLDFDADAPPLLVEEVIAMLSQQLFSQKLFDDDDEDEMVRKERAFLERDRFDENLLIPETDKTTFETAWNFLTSGHDLDEPHLMTVIRQLQASYYTRLRKCNIRIKNAMYLPGAPDPYGILQPGEVFILFPCDGLKSGVNTKCTCYDEGDVVVMRNPMLHPGDIRKLKAVPHEMLYQSLMGTSGGIIFFSVLGDRSVADMMGGGDFDGDKYLVLLSRNDFVPYVNPVEPFVEESEVAIPANITQEDIGLKIFLHLYLSGGENVVGTYTNAWFALADKYGPADPRAMECMRIVNKAMDAAKTGYTPKLNAKLLKEPKPIYIDTGSIKVDNNSLLCRLFKMVVEAEGKNEVSERIHAAFKSSRTGLPLDDMMRVSPGSNISLNTDWCKHYQDYRRAVAGQLDLKTEGSEMSISMLKNKYREQFRKDAMQRYEKYCDEKGNAPGGQHSFRANSGAMEDILETLAAEIYAVTYTQATEKETTKGVYKYATGFCWEICGTHLHAMKRRREMVKAGQSMKEQHLEKVMRYY